MCGFLKQLISQSFTEHRIVLEEIAFDLSNLVSTCVMKLLLIICILSGNLHADKCLICPHSGQKSRNIAAFATMSYLKLLFHS